MKSNGTPDRDKPQALRRRNLLTLLVFGGSSLRIGTLPAAAGTVEQDKTTPRAASMCLGACWPAVFDLDFGSHRRQTIQVDEKVHTKKIGRSSVQYGRIRQITETGHPAVRKHA
jgi:hypothetical protein